MSIRRIVQCSFSAFLVCITYFLIHEIQGFMLYEKARLMLYELFVFQCALLLTKLRLFIL
jgi:hypothetical protein